MGANSIESERGNKLIVIALGGEGEGETDRERDLTGEGNEDSDFVGDQSIGSALNVDISRVPSSYIMFIFFLDNDYLSFSNKKMSRINFFSEIDKHKNVEEHKKDISSIK